MLKKGLLTIYVDQSLIRLKRVLLNWCRSDLSMLNEFSNKVEFTIRDITIRTHHKKL